MKALIQIKDRIDYLCNKRDTDGSLVEHKEINDLVEMLDTFDPHFNKEDFVKEWSAGPKIFCQGGDWARAVKYNRWCKRG